MNVPLRRTSSAANVAARASRLGSDGGDASTTEGASGRCRACFKDCWMEAKMLPREPVMSGLLSTWPASLALAPAVAKGGGGEDGKVAPARPAVQRRRQPPQSAVTT